MHRSIANVVAYNDVNTAAVLQYSIEHLKIQDILVCGHYGCGGVQASCEEYVIGGYIGDWLMIAGWAKRWVLERFQKQGKVHRLVRIFFRLLVEENVRLQVKHLAMLSMLRGRWATTRYPRLGLRHRHGLDYRPRESRCQPSQYSEGLTG